MRRSILHLFLSFILTIAVTDYIWIHFQNDDPVVAKLEIEKEKEGEEELREGQSSKEENKQSFFFLPSSAVSQMIPTINTGFFRLGDTFAPLSQSRRPRIPILYNQLKLDC